MVTGLLAAAGIVWGANGYAASAEKVSAPKEYMQWLDELKKDMSRRGISSETLSKVYAEDYYHPAPEVVKIDRNQNEFVLTFSDYANRVAYPPTVFLAGGGISAPPQPMPLIKGQILVAPFRYVHKARFVGFRCCRSILGVSCGCVVVCALYVKLAVLLLNAVFHGFGFLCLFRA